MSVDSQDEEHLIKQLRGEEGEFMDRPVAVQSTEWPWQWQWHSTQTASGWDAYG